MDTRLPDMTEAELAAWQYAHRDELDLDSGEQVAIDISPRLSVTISLRLPGAEADAIRQAAREANLTLSEWIRRACTSALHPEVRPQQDVQTELHELARVLQTVAHRVETVGHEASPSSPPQGS